jgi:hypothetical protein
MMKRQNAGALILAALMLIGAMATTTDAQQAQPPALTEAGQKLQERYNGMLKTLREQISAALPKNSGQKKAAYLEARKAEKDAEAALSKAQKQVGRVAAAQKAMKDANFPKGGAERGIKAAEAALKKAETDDQRTAAQQDLTKWQKVKDDCINAHKKAEDALAVAKQEEPKWTLECAAAEKALAEVRTKKMQTVDALGESALLSSDKQDSQLVKFVVLFEATPQGLAKFAEQGAQQTALVEQLLTDDALMKQMLLADGAAGGNYGRAMEIYTSIRKTSPKAKEGVLQRLALAIALEHAVPIKQDNPVEQKEAPATVDPIKRYLAYEKAYLGGELDPAFKDLTVWDLRFVVNGDEPDEIAAWGREMLRNYRPDAILDMSPDWRYILAVRTDVRYCRPQGDRPSLQNYQNIIMNGGVCGRRAFFGRFILRAFGIPTTPHPESGHGSVLKWCPEGWNICLGHDWGSGWTVTRYKGDLDFRATTQVRAAGEAYLLQVKRAQWIGDVEGEKRIFGFSVGDPGPWYGVSLFRQKAIIEATKAKTLAAVGTNLGEANDSDESMAAAVKKAAVTDADRKVSVGANGVITIPAAACSDVQTMKSYLGGLQAFCKGNFTCEVDAPNAGKYRLTARIVTVRDDGKMQLTVNNTKDAADIAIPYTFGKWEQTQPVEVTLVQGKNTLVFSKPEVENKKLTRGFTLKNITLTPVK